MRINLWESVVAVAIVVFGGIMAYIGVGYGVGTISDMGPGYFPVMVSLATAAMGVVTFVEVVKSPPAALQISWRAVGSVIAAIGAWAFLAERFGLVPASVVLVLLTSLAKPPVRIVSAIVTGALVSAGAVALFIYGFDLPLHVVKW